jgi:putative heme-binding domain-containing protein
MNQIHFRLFLCGAVLFTLAALPSVADEAKPTLKKIILIAGAKSHGPGEHEYEKGARLLKQCLDSSPNLHGYTTEVYTDGWPRDDKAFDGAATVLFYCDGSDHDEQAHPLLRDKRLETMQKLMGRGVGLVAVHYTVFVPNKRGGEQFLDWLGGYFDYQSGDAPNHWYSKIKNCTAKVAPASPEHPISRGLKPFELHEEFYYNMRFRPDDKRVTPILSAAIPDEKPQTVAWAVERKDGGRGFAYTGGHYHSNWDNENVRRMLLNALVWTAKGDVPVGGVQSRLPEPQKNGAGPTPGKELDYRPADERLKAVLIDRSPDESFASIKADSTGRLFVGGREALFVYEPDGKGGYQPRRELYRFPPDSWLAGIEIRGDDLYVLTDAALYLLPGARTKRDGITPKRLIWGMPLNIHNSCHCLAWGPEGDLYLDHGDPLLDYGDFSRPDHFGHWTIHCQPEGMTVPYSGSGGVFRIHPDGSNFRQVAGGLRGCVGLCFDHSWNLFTNDNDHESKPDLYTPARLMYVSQDIDFAWPRGWIASKSPDRFDLVETMLPAPGRGVPVGMAYYDEPLLPKEYRNCLYQARWDRFTIQRNALTPHGAAFTATDVPFLVGRGTARPIGVAVGRGGRIFAAISYMANNEASPHYPSDLAMITRADDSDAHPFEPYDAVTAPAEKLWAELSNASWQRRSLAHEEILRRGGSLLHEATRRLAALKEDDVSLSHLLWLAAADGSNEATSQLTKRARDPHADVRVQAVRALAEFPKLKAPRELFEKALTDADPRVQLAGLIAFFAMPGEPPLDPVVKLAHGPDLYLRQTAALLLARKAKLEQILELTRSSDSGVQLAGVLAAGMRLTVLPSTFIPPQQVKLTYPPNGDFFKVKIHYAEGEVDLRTLGRVGSFNMAEYWKAIEPDHEQKELFAALLRMLDGSSESPRLQSAYYLSLLRDPRSEPAVARTFQSVLQGRLAGAPLHEVGKVWAVGPFADGERGFQATHPPEVGAIELTAEYPAANGKKLSWQELKAENGHFDLSRLSASGGGSCYLFFRLQSATRQPVLLLTGSAAGLKVWQNGRLIGENAKARAPAAAQDAILLDAQPGSNDVLVRVQIDAKDPRAFLQFRAKGEADATLPDKLDGAMLAQRLREAGAAGKSESVAPEFLKVDWRQASGGDAAKGRKLFGSLGCAKCHAITADQKGGGAPSLTQASKRFTAPYVVESILLPSKQVADAFRSSTLTLTDGRVLAGLVVGETADGLELLQPDATRKPVLKKDIEDRKLSSQSPMPAGLVKTPEELKDLLAYLLSDNPAPP